MTRRYAEGTKVSVEKSRAELTTILTKHGIERQAWMTGPEGDQLGFVYRGRSYRLQVNKPTYAEATSHLSYTTSGMNYVEKEWMRRWRALVLLLKAKIEFAEGDDDAFVREFMPFLLTAGGRTLEEVIADDALEAAIGVPLLEEGPR